MLPLWPWANCSTSLSLSFFMLGIKRCSIALLYCDKCSSHNDSRRCIFIALILHRWRLYSLERLRESPWVTQLGSEESDLNPSLSGPSTCFEPQSCTLASLWRGRDDKAYENCLEHNKQLAIAVYYYVTNHSHYLHDQLNQVCRWQHSTLVKRTRLAESEWRSGVCVAHNPSASYPIILSFRFPAKMVSLLIHMSCSLHNLLFIESEWEEQGQCEANLMLRFHSPYIS